MDEALCVVKKKHFNVMSLRPIDDLQCQIFANFVKKKRRCKKETCETEAPCNLMEVGKFINAVFAVGVHAPAILRRHKRPLFILIYASQDQRCS